SGSRITPDPLLQAKMAFVPVIAFD
ncbi:MAG: hypothetical protein K0R51_3457, partial [Cytophagaceae bacterium]|nr:hypothetical protein [Cytophagaceae bacterium]